MEKVEKSAENSENMPKKPGKPRKPAIFLTILVVMLVLAISAAGPLFYLKYQEKLELEALPDTPVPGLTDLDERKETKITDSDLILALKRKVYILNRSRDSIRTPVEDNFHIANYYAFAEQLYSNNGTLDSGAKLYLLLSGLVDEGKFSQNSAKMAISAAEVEKEYLDLFGEALEHRSTAVGCADFAFDPYAKTYAYDPTSRCLGSSPYYDEGYIYNFTENAAESEIYLYFAGATAYLAEKTDDCFVYSELMDAYTNPLSETKKIADYCKKSDNLDRNFYLSAKNYRNFAKYRYIFQKNPESGAYSFVKSEKL